MGEMPERDTIDENEDDFGSKLAGPFFLGFALIVVSLVIGSLWDSAADPISAEPMADFAARSLGAMVMVIVFFWALPRFHGAEDTSPDARLGVQGWFSLAVIALASIAVGVFVERQLGDLAIEHFGKAKPCAGRYYCELEPIDTVIEFE